jgi:hypothetical protein
VADANKSRSFASLRMTKHFRYKTLINTIL